MRKATKIWLIVAASLTLLGLLIAGGAMFLMKWNVSAFTTGKYTTNTHTFDEAITDIAICANTADVALMRSEDGTCRVVCYEETDVPNTVTVEDGTLRVTKGERKWYHHISLFSGHPLITVYLPEAAYASLTVESDTSDVGLPCELSFERVQIKLSTGDVICSSPVSDTLSIKTSTGDVTVKDVSPTSLDVTTSTGDITLKNVACTGAISIEVTTGKAVLTDVSCQTLNSDGTTGDLRLTNVTVAGRLFAERSTGDVTIKNGTAGHIRVEIGTGDVTLERCDADELGIVTDTGDVRGTLLSDKIFSCQTDTGKVSIPRSSQGGYCDIQTNTGDIVIDIVS